MDSEAEPGAFAYCPDCGEELVGPANFCQHCGFDCRGPATRGADGPDGTDGNRPRETGSPAEGSSPAVADRRALERRISRGLADGWDLEHDFGDHAVMVNRSLGEADTHVLIAVFTIWWTAGIANALYAAYCYFSTTQRVILRPEGIAGAGADTGQVRADPGFASNRHAESMEWTAVGIGWTAVTWLVAVALGAIGVGMGFSGPGIFLFGVAIAAFVVGSAVLPPVRGRLADRHGVTSNGRIRSVDERTVTGLSKPCSVCDDSVERGVERTYREEFCLLGVPITSNGGTNVYCRSCATGAIDRDAATGGDLERAEREPESA